MADNQTTDWQPIETAPKDGTEILAFGMAVKGYPIAWDDQDPRIPGCLVIHWLWLDYEADEPAGEVDGHQVFRKVKKRSCEYWAPNPQQFRPTHWMPLPAAPERANAK